MREPDSPPGPPCRPRPLGGTDPDALLIFLHNLKTDGATLRAILGRQHRDHEICVLGRHADIANLRCEKIDDARLRLKEGHVPFGLHARISRPATYVTLLRTPVKRVVSLYSFIVKGSGDRGIAREAGDSLESLETFVS